MTKKMSNRPELYLVKRDRIPFSDYLAKQAKKKAFEKIGFRPTA